MRNRFVTVLCLVLCGASSEAVDHALPLSFPPLIHQPRAAAPNRHQTGVNFRPRPGRRLTTFGLKLVVASGDDLIEFLPPARARAESETDSDRGESDRPRRFAPMIEGVESDENPVDNDLPPLTTSPESLVPPLPSPMDHAVPLDGVFRENDPTESDDDKKPTSPATERSSLGWLAGNQNHLGMIELDFEPLSRTRYDVFSNDQKTRTYVSSTFGARWLNGPNTPDLPPYLFNILINVGSTIQFSDRFAVDAMISPGWYTDFSNKGVEAFRLPWHFVTFSKANDEWQWVLGISDLSRRDIRLLPVAGFIYQPGSGNVRVDAVFPKPKVAWRAYQSKAYQHGDWSIDRHEGWLYLSGELGGGSWAISRADRSYDVVTYRDYRLFAGLESRRAKGHASRIEIGWIFGRAVEFMSNLGNYNPSDSLMIRCSSDY